MSTPPPIKKMFGNVKSFEEVMATVDAVDAITSEKGTSTAAPTGQVVPMTTRDDTRSAASKPRKPSPKLPEKEVAGEAVPEARLTMQIPASVMEQLETRASIRVNGKKPTVRYLVLKALQVDGYDIEDKFLVKDRRRERA